MENGPGQNQYEQQFYKYSTLNHPAENKFEGNKFEGVSSTNATTFRNTTQNIIPPNVPMNSNTINFNSQGYTSSIQGKPWEVPATTTATSQFARPYSSIQGSTQVVTSTSGPAGGEGSDFLRKIDEQLQASRKQFPSS